MKRAVLVLVSAFQLFSLSAFAVGVQSIEIDANGNVLNSTATNYATGQLKINGVAVTTGGGGAGTWGSITGTLSAQTDLQNALNAKQSTAGTLAIAGFGSITGTLPIANLPTGTTSSTVATGDKGVGTLTLNTPALIYTNPITFTNTSGAWAGTLSPIAQSANTFFGNGTGSSATPTFMSASTARTALGLGTLATQSGTFSGTSSGTNTGDQTITLTGDVTGSGTGSFAATIANSAVTYAKMQNVSANSKLLGSSATGSGAPPSELTLGTNLSISGGTLNATGGGTPGGINTQLQYNNSGAFGGITNATTDGTTVTLTAPTISTINSAAGTTLNLNGTISAAGTSSIAGTAAALTASNAIAGTTNAGAAAGGGVTITGGNAARLTSGNANGGDINLTTGNGIGTGVTGNVVVTNNKLNFPTAGVSITSQDGGILYIGTGAINSQASALAGSYFQANAGSLLVGYAGSYYRGGSNSLYAWSTTSGQPAQTLDTALGRNGAGKVEDNSGTLGKYGQHVAGTVALQSLATPAASPSAAVVGTAGSTTISYSYTDCQADGSCTAASPVVTVTTANATLTSSNKITLTFPALGTNTTYRNVYRTATNGTSPTTTGKINSSNVTTTTFDDTGLAGDASTAPAENKTGSIDGKRRADLLFTADNSYDIGASSATRPRDAYLAGSVKQSTSLGARAYNSANISINNAVTTVLTFDSERFDTDTIHSTSSNTSRLTCKTAGRYMIVGHASWAANSTGIRELDIELNGTTYIAVQTAPTAATIDIGQTVSTIYDLAVNDYVELAGYQNSGGALNVTVNANYSPEFEMVRMP